jgi:hypothetical protein
MRPSAIKSPIWRFIVHRIGGLHEYGCLSIGIFDRSVLIGWRRIVKFEFPKMRING